MATPKFAGLSLAFFITGCAAAFAAESAPASPPPAATPAATTSAPPAASTAAPYTPPGPVAANPAEAEFKPDEGFVSLFNGKDLTGWQYPGGDKFDGKTASADGRFSAENGVLVVHGLVPGATRVIKQIWTAKEFPTDFVLKLQFRASPNADSGIYLRQPQQQLQCRDYVVAGPWRNLAKYKPQDWNDIEVVVTNGVAVSTCNGETLGNPMTLQANGGIGLEADRAQMEYRRIQIKALPPSASSASATPSTASPASAASAP